MVSDLWELHTGHPVSRVPSGYFIQSCGLVPKIGIGLSAGAGGNFWLGGAGSYLTGCSSSITG